MALNLVSSRRLARRSALAAALVLGIAIAGIGRTSHAADPAVHGAYFYDYMPPEHLDSLAAAGFNRALIHLLPDSVTAGAGKTLAARVARGQSLGVEVVPEWLFQSKARLRARPLLRRYTWGTSGPEPTVACPLDSLYWRSALLDRAEEILAAAPAAKRLAVDFEVLNSRRHHYDAGPCVCSFCRREYAHGDPALENKDPAQLSGLATWEEERVAHIAAGLLAEFAARHPGVELGVLDLDLTSFVHRGIAEAFRRAKVPVTDYTESSYSTGAASLAAARARLDTLGLTGTPLVGGLWLKRFGPAELADAIGAIDHRFDGYFLFTTYSLWQAPTRLASAYALQASPADYWHAVKRANAAP